MLGQNVGMAWAQVVTHGNLLRFGRPQPLQIVGRSLACAFFVHDGIHNGHRIFGQHRPLWINHVKVVAELALNQRHFAFKSNQRVADVALGKSRGCGAATTIQHRHIGKNFAGQRLRFAVGFAVFQHGAPNGGPGVAAIARDFGVGNDGLHIGARQIAPVPNLLGIALAHQDDRQRRVGYGLVGELAGPVFGHQAFFNQKVDIAGLVHGHHIGLQAFCHAAHLLAAAAVRLLHSNRFARPGGCLQIAGVDVFVKFARYVVADVEQNGGTSCRAL